jgi:uncharacterized membrane protein YphA (DoxX/SURF4 family)
MRLGTGASLIAQGLTRLRTGPVIVDMLALAAGILLVLGLWTPIAGTLVALIALEKIISQAGDLWGNILLGTLGAGLALLGPGAWSVDARLFGWKLIDVRNRKN